MTHLVKICGVEKRTSKSGKTYYVVHFVEKMNADDTFGYKCISAYAEEVLAEQAKLSLNKEVKVAYFWGGGSCRLLMMY